VIGVLPSGRAPEFQEVFTVTCNDVVARADVNSFGQVYFSGSPGMTGKSGWLSLDGISYLPSGASFDTVAMNGTWHAIGLPYGPLQVTTADNLVVLRGVISGGTTTLLGSLDPQFRPRLARTFIVVCGRSTYYFCRINIDQTGAIALVGLVYPTSWPTWVTLSGISFDPAPTLSKRTLHDDDYKPMVLAAATENTAAMRVNSNTISQYDLESTDEPWNANLYSYVFDSTTV